MSAYQVNKLCHRLYHDRAFREAVQADPNSAQAWSARGVTYERLGDKAKAFTSYGRALALRPKDESARSGLARTGG